MFCPLFVLALAALACSLPTQASPPTERSPLTGPLIPPAALTLIYPKPTPKPTTTPALRTCTVKTGILEGAVNLRSCPSRGCAILGYAEEGELLQLAPTQPESGTWWSIIGKNGLGEVYIYSQYCEVSP